MKTYVHHGVIAGAILSLGLLFLSGEATADSFRVSVHSPNVSVSYGQYDRHGHGASRGYVVRDYGHRRADRGHVEYRGRHYEHHGHGHHKEYDRGYRYDHGYARVVVRRHAYRDPAPRHVCRYERRPVTTVFYDECGRRLYRTEYVTVRLCEHFHH